MRHEKKNTENPLDIRILAASLVVVGQLLTLGGAHVGPLVDSQVTVGDVNITFN